MKDFKQYLMDDGYFRQEELIFADCDRNQRARVSTFLSKAAAFAGYDYDARGLDHEKLYAMREVFLLSRIAMRIHRCPMAREVLDISTWENGARGAHMQRVYELADQSGEVCVSIRSEWILVDPETRRIMRPETFTAKKLGVCNKPIDCPEPKKVMLPKEGLEDLGSRVIRWSGGSAGAGTGGVLHQLQQGGHPGPGAEAVGLPGRAGVPDGGHRPPGDLLYGTVCICE